MAQTKFDITKIRIVGNRSLKAEYTIEIEPAIMTVKDISEVMGLYDRFYILRKA